MRVHFSDFEVSLPAGAHLGIAPSPTRSQGIGWPRYCQGSADISARASEAPVRGSAACHVSGLNADNDVGRSGTHARYAPAARGYRSEAKGAEGRGVGGKERDKRWNRALERDGGDEGVERLYRYGRWRGRETSENAHQGEWEREREGRRKEVKKGAGAGW
ncbi:hypothetical protein C8R44DRAFT_736961 [Mycena epipterygia]|nr:hypothetical protein C8R44DRAFT_736961 [Mycena epipterygia]